MKTKLLSFALASIISLSMSVTTFAQTTSSNTKGIQTQQTTNTKVTTVANNSDVQLKEGKTVRIPLKLKSLGISTNTIIQGNDGYVDLTLQGNVVNYFIVVNQFYTSIMCSMTITDTSSGLSCGTMPVVTSSGSMSYTRYSGHNYRVSIGGYAYQLSTPIASIWASAGWTA